MVTTKSHLNRSKVNVLFVCLGNICRSPLAEGIFKKMVAEADLEDTVFCDSAGTSGWHIGEQPDERSVDNARKHGLELNHKARQISLQDLEQFDYILAMDETNHSDIKALAEGATEHHYKLFRLREFEGEHVESMNVPDPYYGGEETFEEVYHILSKALGRFLSYIIEEHNFK